MLGEMVGELTGKITGKRIVQCHGGEMKIEKTMESSGKVLGNEVTFIATFRSKERPQGGMTSEGSGIIMLKDGGKAVLHGSGISIPGKGPGMSMRGMRYLQTSSAALTRLNNAGLAFEVEIAPDGTVHDKIWEWK